MRSMPAVDCAAIGSPVTRVRATRPLAMRSAAP